MENTPEQSNAPETQSEQDSGLRTGSALMAIAGIGFIGYGIVFLILNFTGGGFELGVHALDGMARGDLNSTVAYYISHLHVATAAFIISTGIAVTALSWYGIRQKLTWAWTTAVVSSVIGLGLALPMHYTADAFSHDWVTHLGPIYLATIIFVIGAIMSFKGVRSS